MSYEAGKIAREVAEKLRNGDSIGDAELMVACAYYEDIAEKLYYLGDVFRLAANETSRLYGTLNGFARARKLI